MTPVDADHFDRLARSLTRAASRRSLLGLLLGTSAIALGTRDAGAACKPGGAPCAGDGACCSGRCLGNGTCGCSKAKPFCQRPANPCKKATCDPASGRCVIRNRPAGAGCPDDGNPCTKDVCDGAGRCTHPPQDGASCADDGNRCTRDVCNAAGQCIHPQIDDYANCPDGICFDGACLACTAVGGLCSGDDECCQHRGGRSACLRGDGEFCGPSSLKICRSGVDGPCESSCDCHGGAPCENGRCGCPEGTVRDCDEFGSCFCCPRDRGNYCGGGCCPFGRCRFCSPFGGSCFCL